ncbi:DNA-binding response regulator, OmpR family, contains REC and winged-helix (wHTH) domain [Salinibacillus kushneri]|uniref:DNA-binding response regulator, OmpR family, contains REC and winged-helix (WHTH) domain n=1 Tax=Salinibacillus kushneri TaxID=237682 RepID=A0A1I0A874_9BACI|nr:response regulator transcription factor [Salinibacillus kushneri]SES90344.1 DNA-binding response regulator, OmpR family, contains REC and winged-helix (wHTH) domain [Salinibacillus kushneri]
MKKILIVEDEMNIAELERDYLDVNGYSCDITTTGEEGLKLAEENGYDLIILDLMLPGVDGFNICRQLRDRLDIPILMVTARKEDIDKIRGFDRGADDYIQKPFNPSELVARVKAHLSRYERLVNKNSEPDEIRFKGLHIDLSSRRLYVNGKERVLRAKEFDLLVLFAANPDRVFTKEELFERIWGIDSLGDITTVTVHIRKIREKIEEDPSNPKYIETIWGVGYRLKK